VPTDRPEFADASWTPSTSLAEQGESEDLGEMRSLKIPVALAVIACVVGALASPALASKTKPKAFFGEFLASRPGGPPITPSNPAIAKNKEGTLDEFYMGGEETGPFSFSCAGLTSEGKVFEERSTSFKTEIKFHKCLATRRLRGGLQEHNIKTKIKGLEMEFHSNGSFVLGKEAENEMKITKGTSVEIKVKGGSCKLIIPQQVVPKNGTNEEREYEGGEYSGEKEKTEKLKKYPDGFKERMEVDWTLSKIIMYVPTEKNGPCSYSKEPGGKYNEELKVVEYPSHMEGELEEVEIHKGELFFESRAEKEAKEKEV
jgi:hypothetical protein